jgi:hypothetical protein
LEKGGVAVVEIRRSGKEGGEMGRGGWGKGVMGQGWGKGGGGEESGGLGEGCPVCSFPGKAAYSASFLYNQILHTSHF